MAGCRAGTRSSGARLGRFGMLLRLAPAREGSGRAGRYRSPASETPWVGSTVRTGAETAGCRPTPGSLRPPARQFPAPTFKQAVGPKGTWDESTSPGRCQMPVSPPRSFASEFSIPFGLVPRVTGASHPITDPGKVSSVAAYSCGRERTLSSFSAPPHPLPIYFNGDPSNPKPDPCSVPSGKGGCKAKGT